VRYLTLAEVLDLHDRVLAASGGGAGVRDLRIVESAVAQPKATFGGEDPYASLNAKAASLCYSLIQGHGFVDGNKRGGHAALEVYLVLNGHEISADVDEQERVFLGLAAGGVTREEACSLARASRGRQIGACPTSR
jgi:death on curing protein